MSISGATLNWKRTRAATEADPRRADVLSRTRRRSPALAVDRRAPITALDHVVISTEDPERAAALYGARLGLDMALDRSHQDWGRLMFFRCGDLIVEIVHRPVAGADRCPRQILGPELARRRRRRDTGTAGRGRPQRLRGARRPQARHPRGQRPRRHLRGAYVADGTDEKTIVVTKPLTVICGRPLLASSFLTLRTIWSASVICPAC